MYKNVVYTKEKQNRLWYISKDKLFSRESFQKYLKIKSPMIWERERKKQVSAYQDLEIVWSQNIVRIYIKRILISQLYVLTMGNIKATATIAATTAPSPE